MVTARKSRILIVDDDPQLRESLSALLRLYDYECQTSADLQNALDVLSKTACDLILLDLQLDNQSGFPVIDYLKEKGLDTQVIIVTGEQSERKAITALKKGAVDYLKKPFEPDELIASVKNAVSRLNQHREDKRLQNTIISSRERYRSIVDSQKDYVLLLSKDYRISFINRTYANYLGNEPKKLIGQFYKNFVYESAHNLLFGSLDTVRTASTAVTIELQILGPKGFSHWQEWDYRGVLDDRGQLSEIQCIGRDVTERKLRSEELEAKKEKFRRLAELTSDWLWEIDNYNVYTYASPVVFDILGYRPEEILGKSPFDFMPANEAKRIKRIFSNLKAEGRPLKNIENINLHKDGSKITLETSGVPIFNQAGAVIGYRGIDRKITIRNMVKRNFSQVPSRPKGTAEKGHHATDHLVSICASCKMVRHGQDFWQRIEDYFEANFNFMFSHGICPECSKKLYPELFEDKQQ